MEVYREILPESYLLILADGGSPSDEPEKVLRKALDRAARSGKVSIWVDCSHLQQLPDHAAKLLRRYARHLSQQGISLILCHLSAAVKEQLLTQAPTLASAVMPTLLDAQQHCRQLINHVPVGQWLAG